MTNLPSTSYLTDDPEGLSQGAQSLLQTPPMPSQDLLRLSETLENFEEQRLSGGYFVWHPGPLHPNRANESSEKVVIQRQTEVIVKEGSTSRIQKQTETIYRGHGSNWTQSIFKSQADPNISQNISGAQLLKDQRIEHVSSDQDSNEPVSRGSIHQRRLERDYEHQRSSRDQYYSQHSHDVGHENSNVMQAHRNIKRPLETNGRFQDQHVAQHPRNQSFDDNSSDKAVIEDRSPSAHASVDMDFRYHKSFGGSRNIRGADDFVSENNRQTMENEQRMYTDHKMPAMSGAECRRDQDSGDFIPSDRDVDEHRYQNTYYSSKYQPELNFNAEEVENTNRNVKDKWSNRNFNEPTSFQTHPSNLEHPDLERSEGMIHHQPNYHSGKRTGVAFEEMGFADNGKSEIYSDYRQTDRRLEEHFPFHRQHNHKVHPERFGRDDFDANRQLEKRIKSPCPPYSQQLGFERQSAVTFNNPGLKQFSPLSHNQEQANKINPQAPASIGGVPKPQHMAFGSTVLRPANESIINRPLGTHQVPPDIHNTSDFNFSLAGSVLADPSFKLARDSIFSTPIRITAPPNNPRDFPLKGMLKPQGFPTSVNLTPSNCHLQMNAPRRIAGVPIGHRGNHANRVWTHNKFQTNSQFKYNNFEKQQNNFVRNPATANPKPMLSRNRGQEFCSVCNVKISGYEHGMIMHCKGKKHLAKVKLQMEKSSSNADSTHSPNTGEPPNKRQLLENKVSNATSNTNPKTDATDSSLPKNKAPDAAHQKSFYCGICKCQILGEFQLEQHVRGASHKFNVQKGETNEKSSDATPGTTATTAAAATIDTVDLDDQEDSPDDQLFHCDVCNCSVYSHSQRLGHLQSNYHKMNTINARNTHQGDVKVVAGATEMK